MAEAAVAVPGSIPDRPVAAGAPALPRLPLGTKLAYGFGLIAYGVKDNGFAYFLLLFYSQVIGVDARLVGLAITLCLVADALWDPIVGYWSDNLRSRWGRRHPFMYAAAIPVAISYYFLWNPPAGWSDQALFWYLLCLAIFIRSTITFFEIPNSALAPELTQDYHERSSLLSIRFYFGWTGGNIMSVVMFGAIFPAFATAAIPDGQFNRDAYAFYGAVASVLMFVAILVSALGTHSRIPHLQAPPPKRRLTPVQIFREIFETLSNRSFVALFLAALLGAIATGLSAALAFYMSLYFWGFTTQQIAVLTAGVFISAVIGSVLAPIVGRRLGKKRGAMVLGLTAFIGAPLPIVLRLMGLIPAGTEVFWFIFAATVIDVGLIIGFQVLSTSMMADLVEQAEVKTGRRSEGLFFATASFVRQLVTGIGVTMASFVLTFAGLKAGMKPSDVSPDTVWKLGALYVPAILSLWMGMMAVISMYRLTEADHQENLATLAARRAAS